MLSRAAIGALLGSVLLCFVSHHPAQASTQTSSQPFCSQQPSSQPSTLSNRSAKTQRWTRSLHNIPWDGWKRGGACRPQTKPRSTKLPGRFRVVRPYPRRWWRYCKWFGIRNRTCYKAWRRPSVRKTKRLVKRMLSWLQDELQRASSRTCRVIAKRRQYYFMVKKPRRVPRRYRFSSRPWWWDRYKGYKHKQYMMVDAATRLIQRNIKKFSQREYKALLRKWTAYLYNKALPMGTEVAMVSRVSRWLKLRPAPMFARNLSRRMAKLMLKKQKCPWWYIVFMGTYAPDELKKLSPKLSTEWCELKHDFAQTDFVTVAQTNSTIKKWARDRRFRRIFRLKRIGCSAEGRPIWAYRIGYPTRNKFVPTAVFVGSQHGDEHLGTDLLLDWTQKLLKRYKRRDPAVMKWLRTRHFWFIPVLNPDGKAFDMLGGVFKWWRFNRGVQHDGQIGVDLNRNFSFKWRRFTYSRYKPFNLPGTHPFAEPETAALRRFVWNIRNLTALLDIHQAGSMLLLPYAHTWQKMGGPYYRWFRRIGKYFTEHNRYKVWRARRLYSHAGTLGDWAFARHKALSYVLELGRSKYLNRKDKQQVIEDNQELLERFSELADSPFQNIDKIWPKYQASRRQQRNTAGN